jgi:hypothetical protein
VKDHKANAVFIRQDAAGKKNNTIALQRIHVFIFFDQLIALELKQLGLQSLHFFTNYTCQSLVILQDQGTSCL